MKIKGNNGYGNGIVQTIKADFRTNWVKYLIIVPVIAFYIIFYYVPMYGAVIAFQDYVPRKGVSGSTWVGLKHFVNFFGDIYFRRILINTLILSVLDIVICFPAAILFAILLNEIRSSRFKRTIQTISYLPHFISLVVICGMIKEFCSYEGLFNYFIVRLGGTQSSILQQPQNFKYVYILSNLWQEIGWNSIIYLAALSGVNEELYEAAEIDGAGRIRQTFVVTLPGIISTIMIMFILRIGQILNVGYEKILLLYNPAIYDTADVVSTFVYRKGLTEFNWSYSTAVGLFNSIVNFIFLIAANYISKKTTQNSLW